MTDRNLFMVQLIRRVRIPRPLPFNGNEMLLSKLQGLVTNLSWSPAEVVKLFKALLKRFGSKKTNDRSDFMLWMMKMLKMLHCIEINYITPSWKSDKTLVELIKDKSITDERLVQILSADREKTLDEIIEKIEQQKSVDKNLLNDVREIVSAVNQDPRTFSGHKSQLKRVLQRLVRAVKETMEITPRLTQMVSWSLMALSEKGRLIQVSTGEGKTCIVAMFAAFRALQGHTVDIMSSSPVLAKRDFNDWQKFYKELKISVSCNINKSNTDLKKCYECQVVYGTAHDFAGDWLKHHFGREDILGNRTFQCAIVDEVDSLMLDEGDHTVYLSCDMPALQHLNPLLAHIWDTANQYTKIDSVTLGPKCLFYQVVLENITQGKDVNQFTLLQLAEDNGTISKGSVKALRQNSSLLSQILANITPEKLAAFFTTVENKYRSSQFVLYKHINNSIKKINQSPQHDTRNKVLLLLHSGGVCQYIYQDRESLLRAAKSEISSVLHFTPCDLRQGRTHCYVPGFLKTLVESKLEDWIEKAFHAQTMTKDHQYVIESHGVVPVDFSCTGVLENSMQWSNGLHKFLEMKHQQKLSDMTAITNFMSNVGLLHMYGDQIYGVTGTLGHSTETETLQKIYNGITACYIPTFKRRKLFEVEGVIVDDEEEWLQKICRVIVEQISPTPYRSERAVLVICETIGRAKALHKALGHSVQNKKLYISNNMDNRDITNSIIEAGQVIVATNLAGRGTDLKVSDSVKSAGGLFVLQTFLPTNARVEAQAFGRTGRQGSPGSAQLIICSTHLPETIQLLLAKEPQLAQNLKYVSAMQLHQTGHEDVDISETVSLVLTGTSDSGIKLAKKVRDESVAEGLSNYMKSAIPKLKEKQELFSQYLDFINDFYQSNNNQPAEPVLSALHEFWGMWLLINVNDKDSSDILKTKLASDLQRARETLKNRQSPLSNLHHYTLFGNELRKRGHFEASINMYSKAIEEDSCWAAIAFYNRAFVRLVQQDNNQDPSCIEQALEDLQQALNSVELYCQQNDIVYRFSKPHLEPELQEALTTRFDAHQEVRRRVFLLFKNNMEEAIRKLSRARNIEGHVKVEERLVLFLAPVTDLLPLLVLSVESVNILRSRDQLRMQQLNNHYAFDIMHGLECLGSLGLTNVYVLDTRFSLGGFFSKIGRSLGHRAKND